MSLDQQLFRTVLGCFPTGVAVITTRDEAGRRHGITVNSFASLSLDPPLVSWSLRLQSRLFPTFAAARSFAVNILGQGQMGLARRFAGYHEDRFADVAVVDGAEGLPLLCEAAAILQCRPYASYPGGDHRLFVGEVVDMHAAQDAGPLAFHRGEFRTIAPLPDDVRFDAVADA